ncbi:hypothetical protein EIN_487700 [Entamoeba invadens IP1]|uniref:Uncharacterized protein n=1 Tax=Entamoeba invadens IP1 TaxID=370355 RepID=A0A0A1UAU0_ENTIV|nr:hypothetical protein EIN_487700 [Entamoeba invadens IP1]ELP89268.1 hypothetical protein EIN_487700 [Entamoeba invadens IP1]|eukprot:XP_004256039.1 hypothetical protein EIN_487700 [Entamoeba invadens IP1]
MKKIVLRLVTVVVGVLLIICILGSFVAFSFAVPHYTYNKDTGLSFDGEKKEGVSCDSKSAKAFRLIVDKFTYQCGYHTTTDVFGYLFYITSLAMSVCAVVFYFFQKKRFFYPGVAMALLTVVMLIATVYMTSVDTHAGSKDCSVFKAAFKSENVKCEKWVFVLPAVTTSIAAVFALAMPPLMMVTRCSKDDSAIGDESILVKEKKPATKKDTKKVENKKNNDFDFGSREQYQYLTPKETSSAQEQKQQTPPPPTEHHDSDFIDFSAMKHD